jgi:aromatic ring-cleaving dioxygenase
MPMQIGDIVQVFDERLAKWNYHTTIHYDSDKVIATEQVRREGSLRYRVVRYTAGKDAEPEIVLG